MSLQDAIMRGDKEAVEKLLKGTVLEDDLNEGIKTSEKRSTPNNAFNMMDTSSKPSEVYKQITEMLQRYKQGYEEVNALNKTTEGQKLPSALLGEIAKILGVEKNADEWANKGGKKTKKRLMKQRKSGKNKSKKTKRTNKRKPRK